MTKLFFVLSCLFLCLPAKCFQLGSSSNPAALALGNCSLALPYSNYGNSNTAILANLQHDFISTSYENRYCTPSIGNINLSYLHAHTAVNIGVNINYFGVPNYGEISVGVIASKRFSNYFSIGVEVDYVGIYLSEKEGIASTYVAQFACSYFPIKDLQIAFKAYNFSFSSIELAYKKKENLPAVFSLGIAYSFKNNIFICAEIRKEIKSIMAYSFGFEYPIIDLLVLRAGVNIQEFASPCFGIGMHLKQVDIDFACQYDLRLGISSSVGLIYHLRR